MRPLALLSLLVVAVSAFAAERPVGTAPAGPAFGAQQPVAIEFAGDEGFVVWTDWRGGVTPAIYGSRINTAGALLDPNGIRINATRNAAEAKGLVATAEGWIAVWFERANLSINARRIGRNGSLLGEPVVLLRANYPNPDKIDVASAGGTIAVAGYWETTPDTPHRHFAIANHDLTNIRTGTALMVNGELVSDGSSYVIFGHSRTLPAGHPARAVRIATDGTVGPLTPAAIIGTVDHASWTGRDFVVEAGGSLFRVSSDLAIVGPPIAPPAGVLEDVVGADGHTAVLFTDGDEVYAAALGELKLEEPVLLGRGVSGPVRAAVTRFGYLVVTEGLRTAMVPLNVSLPAAEPLTGVGEQTRSRAAQTRFAAVRDGASDLYVFIESDGLESRVMIASPRFAPRRLIETGNAQYAPSIASNGSVSLVTWIEEAPDSPLSRVIALPVDSQGNSLVWGPIPIGFADFSIESVWTERDTGTWPAALVWSGSLFFVAWDNQFVRVTSNGTVLDTPPRSLFPPSINRRDHLSMARAGDIVVLAWMEGDWSRGCQRPCQSRVRAMRLSTNGDVIGAFETLDEAARGPAVLPVVAANGDAAVVVWEQNGIRAARVTATSVSSPRTVSSTPALRPTVARHDDGFAVAWETGDGGIPGAGVSGEMNVSPPMPIAREAAEGQGPYAFTAADGSARVGYARTGAITEWVPQAFIADFASAGPPRRRSVRR